MRIDTNEKTPRVVLHFKNGDTKVHSRAVGAVRGEWPYVTLLTPTGPETLNCREDGIAWLEIFDGRPWQIHGPPD